jgi:hypothetical protein
MIVLPQFLRRLPFLLYAFVPVFLLWSLSNEWYVVTRLGDTGQVELNEIIGWYEKSRAILYVVHQAIYLLIGAAVLHALVAIHDKLMGAAE